MKFNIVERGESEEFLEKFIDFYYDKSYNINEICKILDISMGKYQRIKNELIDDGRIDGEYRTKLNHGKAKYYSLNKKYGTYKITRKVRGKHTHFLTVPTEEMAKFCVDLLHRYGWRKQNVPYVRARMMGVFK